MRESRESIWGRPWRIVESMLLFGAAVDDVEVICGGFGGEVGVVNI